MDATAVRDRLRDVEDPDLGDDLVSLGLVNEITIDPDRIHLSLGLGAPGSPTEREIAARVREALSEFDRELTLTAHIEEHRGTVLEDVKNIITVAAGKGGVGKSTVAANLAAGLSKLGADVGLFDADIYGPNLPEMLAADTPPEVVGEETLVPPERYGVTLMSMDYLTDEETPVIWRGPMVDQALTQLLETVQWGSLDYLILDLPPGTGDTQLTILQKMPVTGGVVVTTSQPAALDDARRTVEMFARHDRPVLGLIENMSTFVCPDCGAEHDIFSSGGGQDVAADYEIPFLGSIPLDPAVQGHERDGKPVVLDEQAAVGDSVRTITEAVANAAGAMRRQTHSEHARSSTEV